MVLGGGRGRILVCRGYFVRVVHFVGVGSARKLGEICVGECGRSNSSLRIVRALVGAK